MSEVSLETVAGRLRQELNPELLRAFETQVVNGTSAAQAVADKLGVESAGALVAMFALVADPTLGPAARSLTESLRESAPRLAAQLETEAKRKVAGAETAAPAEEDRSADLGMFPDPFDDVDSLRIVPTFLSTREKLFPVLRLDISYTSQAQPTAISLRAHDVLFLATSLLEALGELEDTISRLGLAERVDDEEYGGLDEYEEKLRLASARLNGPGLNFMRTSRQPRG